MAVEIVPVADRAGLERFIRLPDALHRGDPAWRAPLLAERREALSPRRNPYFRHAEAAFWLARRDGRDVGRVSAQQDRLAPPDEAGHRVGHFGLLAAEDDPAVFAALMGTAEGWVHARGLRRIQGPFSLSINEEAGLLVDGFDTPPMLMMPHDPAYAGPGLEALGYRGVQDLLAYLCDLSSGVPPAMAARVARGLPPGVTLRPLRPRRLGAEVETMVAIFNQAWAGNWGFVPFTPEEAAHLARQLRPLLHPRLVWFAEADGVPVAFAACLPDLNQAAAGLGGKLLPFGWARLLWRLRVAGVHRARVPLMGVRRDVPGLAGPLVLLHLMTVLEREARAAGFDTVELSWVLESNAPMRRLARILGGRPYKRYRIYGKDLPG